MSSLTASIAPDASAETTAKGRKFKLPKMPKVTLPKVALPTFWGKKTSLPPGC
jgi:hypothetical protein